MTRQDYTTQMKKAVGELVRIHFDSPVPELPPPFQWRAADGGPWWMEVKMETPMGFVFEWTKDDLTPGMSVLPHGWHRRIRSIEIEEEL